MAQLHHFVLRTDTAGTSVEMDGRPLMASRVEIECTTKGPPRIRVEFPAVFVDFEGMVEAQLSQPLARSRPG